MRFLMRFVAAVLVLSGIILPVLGSVHHNHPVSTFVIGLALVAVGIGIWRNPLFYSVDAAIEYRARALGVDGFALADKQWAIEHDIADHAGPPVLT